MKNSRYNIDLGEMSACTKRTMEAAKVLDHRDIKRDTEDCFVFGIWFASKRLEKS